MIFFKMKQCHICKQLLKRWRTKHLSGWTCKCESTHTIDQYPNDIQTQQVRATIIETKKIENPDRLNEWDWFKLEQEFGYFD